MQEALNNVDKMRYPNGVDGRGFFVFSIFMCVQFKYLIPKNSITKTKVNNAYLTADQIFKMHIEEYIIKITTTRWTVHVLTSKWTLVTKTTFFLVLSCKYWGIVEG